MKNKGFTLIEIMVTTTLFVAIFSIISGLFFSAIKVQRRALAFQELIRESSYAMEYMSRQLRMAQMSDINHPCAYDDPNYKNYFVNVDENSIAFRNYDDECWTFFLDVNTQRLKVNRIKGPNNYEDFLTSDKLKVMSFKVKVAGDNPTEYTVPPRLQPKITISLDIESIGEKSEKQTQIIIQTTVSQRNLDL